PSLPGSGKNARLSLLSLPLLSSSIAGRSQDAVRYMPTLSLAKRVRMSELFWVSRDLPDRPSVTSDVYCSKPVLKPGSVKIGRASCRESVQGGVGAVALEAR